MAFCGQEGIEVLDLEPVFDGQDLTRMRVHVHDSHPSAAAHRLAGAAIAEHLLAGALSDSQVSR